MTIAEALKKYSQIEADLLLGHVLKKSKEFLYMNGSKKLTTKQALSIKNMAEKRLNGMPAAYLLGYKYFYALKFKVNRNVLIPRPETEWLVDEALKLILTKLKENPRKEVRILDVGTGSGAIAISIAHEMAINNLSNKVKVFATDISEPALKVAKNNAKANKVNIKFSRHDLLKGVKVKFDIIIANLPYVRNSDYRKQYLNLRYEPKVALTDGTDNSELIQEFLKQVPKFLYTKGMAILEIDPSTVKVVNMKKFKIVKDINNFNRFLKLR